MSAAAMQAAGRHVPVPTTVYSTATTSSPNTRQYVAQDYDEDESYYLNHNAGTVNANPAHQQPSRRHQNPDPARHAQYPTVESSEQYYQTHPSQQYATTALPSHLRDQSYTQEQYDGTPAVPPRTTSHQVSPSVTSTSRSTRDAQKHPNQHVNAVGDYHTPSRDRSRDDTAAAATGSARSRRRGPTSPEGPHRATSTKERGQPQGISTQSRSEATMNAPAPLMRENSEVLNRMVVSDPTVDEERMRARIAEAQPMAPSVEATNMGLTSELPEDGGRGPQKRQDYSKSKRREIQFGDYVLGQTLGEGEFGKVKLGWKKDGSTQVAIKLIRRESVASNPTRLPKIYREIAILRDLAHPNIVRLHEMVETERHIGIILEYASGGELFDYILNQRYLKDPSARRLFAQLVSGVGYLHKKGIVHRDLKLENLLLDQNKNIIITDFGFANTFNPHNELSPEIEYNLGNKDFVRKYRLDRIDANGMRKGDLMQTSCGSPCYAAPELVVSDSLYTGRKVDVWSCGVILYAMLAGYLPFDDDPANPEGDNINLLYKYITTTPLTFPEYVTPHARDLLRRILVPDPRKRADLFEVARHSWLSEFHHVVANITSSTTNVADIANSTVTIGADEEQALPYRSASVRGPSATSPPQQQPSQQPEVVTTNIRDDPNSKRERGTRHTLQAEYVAPKSHTERIGGPEPIARTKTENPGISNLPASMSKPLPQDPPRSVQDNVAFNRPAPQPVTTGPSRPARDVPRSISDVAGNLSNTVIAPAPNQFAARPSTQGSLTSANGPTRSDLRLPSRGSYGQPVAPSVATTTAQGKVTQPAKAGRGYNISGPQYQHGAHNSIGQPMTTPAPPSAQPQPQQQKTHHRRTSTLSSLGEKLFGRSNSVSKKDREERQQKTGRKYPPTSMKASYPEEPQPRMSTDSKRSFSFGLRKKESTDGSQPQEEKPGRRFSLLPSSMSFKNFGSNKEQSENSRVQSPEEQIGKVPTNDSAYTYGNANNDGQQERKYNNFSRPPQAQNYGHRTHASTNDVYGSTGVYMPESQQHRMQQNQHQHQRAESYSPMPRYNESYGDQPRPSMNSGRNVLTKPNRRFNDAYDQDSNRGGSSGAVKKVQDFFRRRGRARADSEYR